ncbi:BolA family protein [Pseudoroseicyclus sp. CXY001]|uniref:BolA family protein n=1 Tax=Pseudoroseicyclus sp. CXY001 TaxID=3242492 RepID=UPI0035716953
MDVEALMHQRLTEAFAPEALEIVNESHLHAGHAGDDGSGESHWRIVIGAPALAPLSRVARHRAVHAAIGEDVIGRIHALTIQIA